MHTATQKIAPFLWFGAEATARLARELRHWVNSQGEGREVGRRLWAAGGCEQVRMRYNSVAGVRAAI